MNRSKRIFDIVLATTCAVLLAPIVLAIVVAMKATSPGPLLFRQKRLGKDGKIFLINKFRKFPADWGAVGPGVTLQGDSRMTNIGELLERTKLDEVPQLWNIFIGEMSFVGPRPESLAFSHLLQSKYSEVLNYTPGLFGPNQIKYRNESTMYPVGVDPVEFYENNLLPNKAKADLEYFSQSTFLADVGWIAKGGFTLVFNVISCKKAFIPTAVLIVWDLLALAAAWVGAHWLKYAFLQSGNIPQSVTDTFYGGVLALPITLICIFPLARVYRNPVRYFAETDAFRLIGAACAVWIVAAMAFGLLEYSTSSLLLAVACMMSIGLFILPRISYAYYQASLESRRNSIPAHDRVNVLVCGISTQSLQISSMLRHGFDNANVIGLVSSQPSMVRRAIKGFSVLGTYADFNVINSRYGIDQIWHGPAISKEEKNLVNSWCHGNDVDCVSIASQPGFRKLVTPEFPVAETESAESRKGQRAEVAA